MTFNYSEPLVKKLIYILLPLYDSLKVLLLRNRLIIHGSYYTSNNGDRAIAIVLKNELKKVGYKSVLVSHFYSKCKNRNIIIGGGGVIHNCYENNLVYRTRPLKKNNNVLYIGVGSPGFAPLSNQDKENLALLHKAKYISVRDKFTYEQLMENAKLQTEILACPAWLIYKYVYYKDFSLRNLIFRTYYNFLFHEKRDTCKSSQIGLILNGHFDLNYLSLIKEFILEESKQNEIIFIPFVGEDIEFYQKELKDINISNIKLKDPITTYNFMTNMDKIIASRYHSVIFSLLMNKPTLILAYSQKVLSLAEELKMNYVDLCYGNKREFLYNDTLDHKLVENKITQAETQISRMILNLKCQI